MNPPDDWSQFVPEDPYRGSEYSENAVEVIKQNVGIVEAYRKWIGKSEPDESRVESIMVSCPMPGHEDKHPSAWMNSEKDLWFCAACEKGGDIIDLGAIRFGYDITADYSNNFPELITLLLADLGLNAMSYVDPGTSNIPDREKVDVDTPLPKALQPLALKDEEDVIANPDLEPNASLDWEPLLKDETFITEWMKATTHSLIPNEFLFFLGFQMIGLACGPDVKLESEFPVEPNFNLALIGSTGMGKSLGLKLAKDVLGKAIPWDENDSDNKGVKLMGRPGSGESLFEQFSWINLGTNEPIPVRGLVEIDELSEFMSASQRKGTILREAVIKVSDGHNKIEHTLRANSIKAARPYCCITTGAQPDALSDILTTHDVTGGFANRFLYVRGTGKQRKTWGVQEVVDLAGLDVYLQDIHNWAKRKQAVRVDTAAYSAIDALMVKLDGVRHQHGVLARIDLLAQKLLITMAANQKTTVITAEMINELSSLMDFLIQGANLIYEKVDDTEYKRLWKRIYEVVEWYPAKHNQHPTINQILKAGWDGTTRQKKKPTIVNMIVEMANKGVLLKMPNTRQEIAETPKGQRPPTRYGVAL